MVFNGVVGSAGEELGDLSPFVADALLGFVDVLFLGGVKGGMKEGGVMGGGESERGAKEKGWGEERSDDAA